MLPWKAKPIRTDTACPKKLAMTFEVGKGGFKILDGLVGVEILSGKVAEIEEAAKAADNLGGDMPFDRRKIDLLIMLAECPRVRNEDCTFISALESSPVHCLKWRP
jgi:hypothetical protein